MEVAQIAKRSCGTCRDRRILCDRATPSCVQCSRSNRTCKGYGLRLSWPKPNDRKRAITIKAGLQLNRGHFVSHTRAIHMSDLDVEMHHYLTSKVSARPALEIPMPWRPSFLEGENLNMLQYFQCVASQSLTTIGQDPAELGDTIIRLALKSDTPSAAAVCHSLLALSSLHRYGVQAEAVKLKISCLRTLAAASKSDLSQVEITQHVAAGMLLCSFEVHQSSCTSSQWTWYIAGIREIIKAGIATKCDQSAIDGDRSSLLNWVYYHDVLAQFTLNHWIRGFVKVSSCALSKSVEELEPKLHGKIRYPDCQRLFSTSPVIASILGLLAEVSTATSIRQLKSTSKEATDDFVAHLKILDWRLRKIQIPEPGDENRETTMMLELYQLAALVYLNRTFEDLLHQQARTAQHIDRAFVLLRQLSSCERQFPVFVIGCEARTDDQRAIILDLIARTQRKASSRSLNHVTILVQAIWNQDDLADGTIDYWYKLSSIISSCAIVPSLV